MLAEVGERLGAIPVRSVLDLGAGPATATCAARLFLPELTSATLVESDAALVELGREVMATTMFRSEWLSSDMRSFKVLPESDMVIASYALGELPQDEAIDIVRKAWTAARVALVVIEPGTPAGFARIRRWREQLLAQGAHMAAPCPGAEACPMSGGDWCHFAQRVERMSIHRKLKGGALGHEDEKFSYLAFSRLPVPQAAERVLRHPQHRPGLVELELCSGASTRTEKVTKKDKERFRAARKIVWGDAWE